MKITKLTDSKFMVTTEEDNRIFSWEELLTFLDDICEHLHRDIPDIIAELASYRNGAILNL